MQIFIFEVMSLSLKLLNYSCSTSVCDSYYRNDVLDGWSYPVTFIHICNEDLIFQAPIVISVTFF